jgi:hypothetical protein
MIGTIVMAYQTRLALGLLAALTAGCESDQERADSAKFGDSVRHAIALQTAAPSTTGPGLDAVKAQQTLRVYRADVAQPKKVEQPLIINIGSGSSGGK